MPVQTADSSYQAMAILGAWQTGDEARLRAELDRVESMGQAASDSGEAERQELLYEIARELRLSYQLFGGESSQVCRELLKHLALSGMRAGRWPAIRTSARVRGPVTVLQ